MNNKIHPLCSSLVFFCIFVIIIALLCDLILLSYFLHLLDRCGHRWVVLRQPLHIIFKRRHHRHILEAESAAIAVLWLERPIFRPTAVACGTRPDKGLLVRRHALGFVSPELTSAAPVRSAKYEYFTHVAMHSGMHWTLWYQHLSPCPTVCSFPHVVQYFDVSAVL